MTAMDGLVFVSADELGALQRQGRPVLVAFVATWNRRCQRFAPEFRQLAAQATGGVTLVCADVDESPALVLQHGVCSVPTVLWLQAGRERQRWVGVDLSPLAEALRSMPLPPAG